jgi:hypothetical protein
MTTEEADIAVREVVVDVGCSLVAPVTSPHPTAASKMEVEVVAAVVAVTVVPCINPRQLSHTQAATSMAGTGAERRTMGMERVEVVATVVEVDCMALRLVDAVATVVALTTVVAPVMVAQLNTAVNKHMRLLSRTVDPAHMEATERRLQLLPGTITMGTVAMAGMADIKVLLEEAMVDRINSLGDEVVLAAADGIKNIS